MIYALGSVSGTHFNPAVTLAIFLSGRGKVSGPAEMGAYMAAQLLGGACAGGVYEACYKGEAFPLAPGTGYGWAAVGAAEVVFTFVLCFVVLSVATTKAGLSEYFGLAIGSCVTAGGCAIGAVSGGSLNPAVSVGIATGAAKDHADKFWHCAVYSLLELVGAGLAAGVFMVCHAAEYEPEEKSEEAT